jgi:hypothetical protein
MVKIRRSLLTDTVSVETYAGTGAVGPILADPVQVRVKADTTRRLVRDADGAEVVSELTLLVHPDDEAKFTPQTKLVWAGRGSTVLSVSPQTFRGQKSLVKVVCS